MIDSPQLKDCSNTQMKPLKKLTMQPFSLFPTHSVQGAFLLFNVKRFFKAVIDASLKFRRLLIFVAIEILMAKCTFKKIEKRFLTLSKNKSKY